MKRTTSTKTVSDSYGWQWIFCTDLAESMAEEDPKVAKVLTRIVLAVIDDLRQKRNPRANAEIADICLALSSHGVSMASVEIAAAGEAW